MSLIADRRLRQAAVAICLAAAVATVVAGWRQTLLVPRSVWRLEIDVAAALVMALCLAAAVVASLPPRLGMLLGACLGAATILAALEQRPPRRGDRSLGLLTAARVWSSPVEWARLTVASHDLNYGYRPKPSSVQHDHGRDYDVDYTIDADGWRQMPPSDAPPDARPVLFVGGSYEFGQGVRDEETFSAQLQAHAWRPFRVLNRAVYGWGTTHALLVTEDACAEQRPPLLVCYGYSPAHVMRNYLGKSWHQTVKVDFPYFDLEQDKVVYHGIRPATFATLPDSPELKAQEQRMTIALIEEMQRVCRRVGAAFVVLVLQSDRDDAVLAELRRRTSIPLIDLWDRSVAYFTYDQHPNAEWHQAVARAIASEPWFAEATGIAELRQPDAIPAPPDAWYLKPMEAVGANAALHILPGEPPIARVEAIHAPRGDVFDVRLWRGAFMVRAGETCRVRFRIRADERRGVHFRLDSQEQGGFSIRGFDIGPQWQEFEFEHAPTKTERGLYLHFALGQATAPVEITAVRVTIDDREVLADRPAETTNEK